MICDVHEIRDDVFPGAGEFPGGMGVVKSQRFLTPGFMTHESDRNEDVPWGIFGGHEGATAAVRIHNHDSGEAPREVAAKFSGMRAELGDAVTYLSPCGGGYGNPLKRDPAKVLDDLLDGYITAGHARQVYGVVFKAVTNGYDWGLDSIGTDALRNQMRAG